MDDLLTNYDAIVVGTGMTESILAAALSRIGKSVLHLDGNEFYGENWASFNFEGIQNWIDRRKNDDGDDKDRNELDRSELKENEKLFRIKSESCIFNVEQKWQSRKSNSVASNEQASPPPSIDVDKVESKTEDSVEGENEKKIDDIEDAFRRESRRFNMDLCPKILFSRGPLVELLISSNIAKYAEFKSVSRVLTWRNECLEIVPCSRANVFSTKNITVVEKRLLVKILTLFLQYPENAEEFNGFENKTFIEFLKHKKLPDNIIHYVLYAMAMGDKNTSCLDGLSASKAFLESLGRYGNTPFIFPMYGAGELPQCFCRLCAVFGGVYCLKRGAEAIIVKGNKCEGIISANKRLNAETFILSSNYVPRDFFVKKEICTVARGIFITDRSILPNEKEQLTLLLFPPVPRVAENSVTVIELGPGTNTCPEKYFLVHMTTVAKDAASSAFRHVVDALFRSENERSGPAGEGVDSEKPKILWSMTWNMVHSSYHNPEDEAAERLQNVKVCTGPDAELDFNSSIEEAQRIFKEICPDEEFLPRAPDPDEIILESDEKAEDKGSAEEDDALPQEEKDSSREGNESTAEEKTAEEPEEDKKTSATVEDDADRGDGQNN